MRLRKNVHAVAVLIVVNTVIFLLMTFSPQVKLQFMEYFPLNRDGLAEGHWWELFTHAFLHGNIWHLLFNMTGLWFAGRIVERVMGTGRFLVLYFLSAAVGGLFQMALAGNSILIGASGAVCGVLLAFTTIFSEAQILALVLFVVPLRLRGKYLGWGLVLGALVFLVLGFEPGIGHAAHLGGFVTGYFFARFCGYGMPSWIERWFSAKFRSVSA